MNLDINNKNTMNQNMDKVVYKLFTLDDEIDLSSILNSYKISNIDYFFNSIYESLMNKCSIELISKVFENNKELYFAKDNHAIRYASEYGHIEVVKFLLEHGCDPKANVNWAIIRASRYGHIEVVKILLEHGCDPKAIDNCAIILASQNGHIEIVKILLDHGCSADAAILNAESDKMKELIKNYKCESKLSRHILKLEKELSEVKLLKTDSELFEHLMK